MNDQAIVGCWRWWIVDALPKVIKCDTSFRIKEESMVVFVPDRRAQLVAVPLWTLRAEVGSSCRHRLHSIFSWPHPRHLVCCVGSPAWPILLFISCCRFRRCLQMSGVVIVAIWVIKSAAQLWAV